MTMATRDRKKHSVKTGLGALRVSERITGLVWFLIILGTPAGLIWVGSNEAIKGYIAPGVSISLAIASVATQRWAAVKSKIASSEAILSEATLELLNDAVSRVSHSISTGQRDRLEWLTAAREIATARELAKDVEDPTRRAVLEEKELLLRLKMSQIFIPREGEKEFRGQPMKFYADSARDYISYTTSSVKRAPIDEASLVEVYRFAHWPKGRRDILPTTHIFTNDEIEEMTISGPRELGKLIQEKRRLMSYIADAPKLRTTLGIPPNQLLNSYDLDRSYQAILNRLDPDSPAYEERLAELTSARDALKELYPPSEIEDPTSSIQSAPASNKDCQ